jgi:hypothetical protein
VTGSGVIVVTGTTATALVTVTVYSLVIIVVGTASKYAYPENVSHTSWVVVESSGSVVAATEPKHKITTDARSMVRSYRSLRIRTVSRVYEKNRSNARLPIYAPTCFLARGTRIEYCCIP